MIKYVAHKDPLYRQRMMMLLRTEPSFKRVFLIDLTAQLFAYFQDVVDVNREFTTNTIINLSGLSGTGKSALVMSLGLKFFPHFSWENFFFFDQQLLDEAPNFPKHTLIVRDENPAKMVYGEGSNRIESQIEVLVEVTRKAALNICFIEPSYVKSNMAKIILETVDMDIKHRITRVAMRDTRSDLYMGAAYIPIIPENNHNWVQYNLKKDYFIEQIRKGNVNDAKTNLMSNVEKVFEHPEFPHCRIKGERKALVQSIFPNFTIGEIKTISVMLEMKLRKQKSGEAR